MEPVQVSRLHTSSQKGPNKDNGPYEAGLCGFSCCLE